MFFIPTGLFPPDTAVVTDIKSSFYASPPEHALTDSRVSIVCSSSFSQVLNLFLLRNVNIIGGGIMIISFSEEITSTNYNVGFYQCASSRSYPAESNLYTSEETSLYLLAACE